MFCIGYNTNGLAHHRPLDALRLVNDLGYEALAITPDPGCLDPWNLGATELADFARWSNDLGMQLVIETGSRFLLDAKHKHFPTLLEEQATDRGRRIDFLKRCIDMAAALDAPVVSIWSGSAQNGVAADWPASKKQSSSSSEPIWERLASGISELLDFASGTGVQVCFEPEPGMFIAGPSGFGELLERLGSRQENQLAMTLDVGHCLVTGDSIEATIRNWSTHIANVHLDDIADGIHDHRMFGTGDLDLSAALGALIEVGFSGVASVELSRDSHRGAAAAKEAMDHIRSALGPGRQKL